MAVLANPRAMSLSIELANGGGISDPALATAVPHSGNMPRAWEIKRMARLKKLEDAIPKFAEGESVQLKSGGPQMTVESVIPVRNKTSLRDNDEDYPIIGYNYSCQWFAGKKLEKERFREVVLLAYKVEKEGKNNEST